MQIAGEYNNPHVESQNSNEIKDQRISTLDEIRHHVARVEFTYEHLWILAGAVGHSSTCEFHTSTDVPIENAAVEIREKNLKTWLLILNLSLKSAFDRPEKISRKQ